MAETRSEHFRVGLRVGDSTFIQPEHFESRFSAEAYIEKHRASGWVGDDEQVVILVDYDSRIYPAWRPNRPAQPTPMWASMPENSEPPASLLSSAEPEPR